MTLKEVREKMDDMRRQEEEKASCHPVPRQMGATRRISGYEAYHSPEFRAFAELIGLELNLHTKDVTVTICLSEDTVTITQSYQGRTPRQKDVITDTTTLQNEKYKTKEARTPADFPEGY